VNPSETISASLTIPRKDAVSNYAPYSMMWTKTSRVVDSMTGMNTNSSRLRLMPRSVRQSWQTL
jgi:hypothetical protein